MARAFFSLSLVISKIWRISHKNLAKFVKFTLENPSFPLFILKNPQKLMKKKTTSYEFSKKHLKNYFLKTWLRNGFRFRILGDFFYI
jgi:hypothetical protein